MADAILKLAYEVSRVTEEKVNLIDDVTRRTSVLALNARIEAARAGDAGAAFGIVAQEMGSLARDISAISNDLRDAVASNIARLQEVGTQIQLELRGERFADLARSAVEIIDRNLYERSCDVRWWATDSAIVDAVTDPSEDRLDFASSRLATILRSYTVYLDLWIADADGNVVANGRSEAYPHVVGLDVSDSEWFANGMRTPDGNSFVVCDIARNAALGRAAVATYATAIRAEGDPHGARLGVLGIFFDWEPQARAIVESVSLTEEERGSARVMILSDDNVVLASSDGIELLTESYDLQRKGATRGYYQAGESMVAYAQTPGYETYRGLGWWGCIVQRQATDAALDR